MEDQGILNVSKETFKKRFKHWDKETIMAGTDPWKHRSKGMCCKTCMWSVIKEPKEGKVVEAKLGRCRRRAPTMSGYPAIFETDWCGDHKLDENKL